MTEYLALCNRLLGNELVAAECENLTGGSPDADGLAVCRSIEHIRHAAYVTTGLRLIAQAESLDALLHAIQGTGFEAEGFRIEYQRLSASNPLRWHAARGAIANVLKGYPNMDRPQHRFLLVTCERRLWFGEILVETTHSYKLHDRKPYRTSSSLPAQMARALVNLVAPPASSLFDPCCGTGSILLEAQCLGLKAYGADINPRMVRMSQKNLAHFAYPAELQVADARQHTLGADAIVTDLPYGKFSLMNEQNLRQVLQGCAYAAPVAVFVAGSDISEWLNLAGYQEIKIFRVRKREGFSRFVHRARSSRCAGARLPLNLL